MLIGIKVGTEVVGVSVGLTSAPSRGDRGQIYRVSANYGSKGEVEKTATFISQTALSVWRRLRTGEKKKRKKVN